MTHLVHINNCYKHIDLLSQNNLIDEQDAINMACTSVIYNKKGECEVGVDRTVTNRVNYLNAPIPPLRAVGDLADIMISRAETLWSVGKPLKILWSGGIDSTAALVALIKTNSEWYKSLEVINTSNEYPYFSETFLKPHNCFIDLSTNKELLVNPSFYNDQFVYITGDHADQLFGPGFRRVPGGARMRYAPVSTVYDGYIDFLWMKAVQNNKHYDIIQQLAALNTVDVLSQWVKGFVNRCPVQLNTMFDFLWWCNFVLTWHEKKSFKFVGKTGDPSITSKLQSFFDDEDMQIWSITNNDKKMGNFDEWKTCKQPLKDFIFSFTNDADYRDNFIKIPSKIVDDTSHKIVYGDSSGFTAATYDQLTGDILAKSIV